MKGRIGLVMTAVLVLGTLECPWAVPAWAAAEYAAEAEQEFGSAQETMSDEENFWRKRVFRPMNTKPIGRKVNVPQETQRN